MPGVSTTHHASLPARIIYAIFNAVLPRLVRLVTVRGNRTTLPHRLTLLGRGVNSVARLQRLRPFFGIRFTRDHTADVPVEVVRRRDCVAPLGDGVILYFHGGGFFLGGFDTHVHVVANLARRTRLPVVHVEYRQFPEVMVDGSVQDCVGAYRWLLAQGADPAKTVFGGDSAGGFLAFATALAAQQQGLPAPAGVIGISPLLELDDTARSSHANLHRDAFGVAEGLPDVMRTVCPSPELRHDLAPINGRLETMPPSLLIVSESELLRCDTDRLYVALQQHNRPCRLEIFDSQLHAFPALFPLLPESRLAYEIITRFVAQCLADAGRADDIRRDVS